MAIVQGYRTQPTRPTEPDDEYKNMKVYNPNPLSPENIMRSYEKMFGRPSGGMSIPQMQSAVMDPVSRARSAGKQAGLQQKSLEEESKAWHEEYRRAYK